MKSFVVSLDVGGTTIKAGIADPELDLLNMGIDIYPSESDKEAGVIIKNIVRIILDQRKKIIKAGGIPIGAALGFPGPFDYKKGISYIKGIGKYDSIYGIDIAAKIMDLPAWEEAVTGRDFHLVFENDAVVFALGEYLRGKARGYDKVMCLTLGTGCGSTFLRKGSKISSEYGIPESGHIFGQPYKEGIVDDYISRRGILRLAAEKGFDTDHNDVKEIDISARKGDMKAREVFREFGVWLGEVINGYAKGFRPDMIILGGKISLAFDLFKEDMYAQIREHTVEVKISDDSSKSALIGAASLIVKNHIDLN